LESSETTMERALVTARSQNAKSDKKTQDLKAQNESLQARVLALSQPGEPQPALSAMIAGTRVIVTDDNRIAGKSNSKLMYTAVY